MVSPQYPCLTHGPKAEIPVGVLPKRESLPASSYIKPSAATVRNVTYVHGGALVRVGLAGAGISSMNE